MKTTLMAVMTMFGLAMAPAAFADPAKPVSATVSTPELDAFNRAVEATAGATATTFCTSRVVGCCPNGAQRVKYTCEGGHTIVYKCEGNRC